MSDVTTAAAQIAEWPEVAAAVRSAMDACTELRWHEALRRRTREAASESRLQGAIASARLDGVTCPESLARRWWCALDQHGEGDSEEQVITAALRVSAETEHLHARGVEATPHVLARLHVACAGRSAVAGQPRSASDPPPQEFLPLGPAAIPAAVQATVPMLSQLWGDQPTSVVVRAGLVHAELARLRPFTRWNGLVARAVSRWMLWHGGVDPTGVAVIEAGCLQSGVTAYHGALVAYTEGSRTGVATWMTWWAEAVRAGALEGRFIADAIMRGATQSRPT